MATGLSADDRRTCVEELQFLALGVVIARELLVHLAQQLVRLLLFPIHGSVNTVFKMFSKLDSTKQSK